MRPPWRSDPKGAEPGHDLNRAACVLATRPCPFHGERDDEVVGGPAGASLPPHRLPDGEETGSRSVRRPVSRVLSPQAGDGHSSGPPIAERFSRPTRTPRAGEPCARRRAVSLFGLAPGGACHAGPVARPAVGSYPTLSPLPPPRRGRFAFCGAIPRVAPGGRYPPPFRRGARTFLDACAPRPPDRLTGRQLHC